MSQSHLNEVGYGYFQHLYRAWKIAFILLVHGLFPNIWKTKASDLLCKERIGDDATRAYLLRTMWNILPRDERPTPSVWDRLSTREVATRYELGNLERVSKAKAEPVKKKKSKKKND